MLVLIAFCLAVLVYVHPGLSPPSSLQPPRIYEGKGSQWQKGPGAGTPKTPPLLSPALPSCSLLLDL
jgi:hypothetical protein